MKIFGIIAEYNPFHNGHEYQLSIAKTLGATHIVAIMSANFTQRGEPAITNKFYRATAAVNSGVDLVIELPTPYSLSSAEKFAFGSVYLFNKLNVIDKLIFGVEANNINVLNKIVSTIENSEINNKISNYLKQGISFAKARQMALENLLGSSIAQEISKPNNILAIEYIKWIKRLKSNIIPISIKRIGVDHDSKNINKKITSALNLRELIKNKNNTSCWEQFVPHQAYEIYNQAFCNGLLPATEALGERAILAKLRSTPIEKIKNILDVSEGIENRIFKNIQNFSSINEIYENIKTKRYTMARIKRTIYNIFLNIDSSKSNLLPPYVRILAMNEKGAQIVSKIKKSSDVKINSNLKELSKFSSVSKISADIEVNATNLYSLFCKNILACNIDYNRFFSI